jgi:hypothetical protein
VTEATRVIAAIYAAKSSKDTNDSTVEQIKLSREHVAENEWEHDEQDEFVDIEKSGFRSSRGDGLVAAKARCVELVRDNPGVDVVLLAWEPSRFARGDGIGVAQVLSHFWDAKRDGYRIESVTESLANDTDAFMQGKQSHAHSLAVSKGVIRGRRRAVTQLGRRNGGPAPFGYEHKVLGVDPETRKPITKLTQVPYQAEAIKLMFEQFAAGLSQGEIARRMNARGIRTSPSKHHPAGCAIEQPRVSAWLRSRLYIGEVMLNNKWYKGEHEKVVPLELFEHVQRLLAGTPRQPGGRKATLDVFLVGNGHLKCECGGTMRVSREQGPDNRVVEAYRCYNRGAGVNECTMPRQNRHEIDMAIWIAFEAVGLDDEASAAQVERTLQLARVELQERIAFEETKLRAADAALAAADEKIALIDAEDYNRLTGSARAKASAAEQVLHGLRQEEAALAVNAIFDDSQQQYRDQLAQIREAVGFSRTNATGIPEARAAIGSIFRYFVLHRRAKPLNGVTTWLEPVPYEEAITTTPLNQGAGYYGASDGELAKARLPGFSNASKPPPAESERETTPARGRATR